MKRLENGLVEGVNYTKDNLTGKINWLKMIPSEYLYINQDKKSSLEKRLNKKFEDIQINEVLDTDLVITLSGIRHLLDLRGYKYSKIKIDVANQDYAAASCEICFIANEEENFDQIFTGSASAHPGNTKNWYANYLVEASSNRALCRAVRNFLKINIVSREELGESTQEEPTTTINPNSQVEILDNLLKSKNITFEQFKKAKLIPDGIVGAETINSLSELPKDVIFSYIERIKGSKK